MSDLPRISVVITNHNYAEFLPAALDSVFAQTHAPHEIVLVDDGSTDDSRAVIQHYAVRAVFQANAGQAAALDAGVRECTGDIICLLDADDVWLPNKLERVTAMLTGRPVDWILHRLAVTDQVLAPSGVTIPRIRRSALVRPSVLLLAERVITASTSALAFRRAAAQRVFPLAGAGDLRFDADAVLLARLGSRYAGWQLNEVLGYYRRHARQQYRTSGDMRRLIARQIDVGTLIAAALAAPESVSNHKLRAVLHALDRKSRRGDVASGLAASLRLIGRPGVMMRQTASLLYAAAAPHAWIARLKREQGLS